MSGMSPSGFLVSLLLKLPAATTRRIAVERDLSVPMPDGVTLLADRYFPKTHDALPTILVRSPYGRRGAYALLLARPFAERGFQVVVQSCRGTFGSGGRFEAFRDERSDGLATLRWLHRQPWFSGTFAMVGSSYLGMVQWAIASEAGPGLKAMVPQITASEFRSSIFTGDSFSLDTGLTWIYQLSHQEETSAEKVRAVRRVRSVLGAARMHLPLRTADEAATGGVVPFFRDWLEHDKPGDPWWKPADFSADVAKVSAPIHVIGGWYDLFLPDVVADFQRLQRAGRAPYLTVGPWTHTSVGFVPVALRESIAWFRAHLLGDRSQLREAPVRLFVMGEGRWRDFARWPPDFQSVRWHLQPEGRLTREAPPESSPDRYRYDPADPTPAVGGSSLSLNSGPRDNRALEARSDVLCYTSAPLAGPLQLAGPVAAELHVSSSLPYADFHVRLCDVFRSGKSINICDGLVRLSRPDEGIQREKILVSLWPTAYTLKAGHRIRVQVSSGAHPRWARNTGTGEPLAAATRLAAAEQHVFHDSQRPSAVILPVLIPS
jgi:uncharacterized protein